MKHGRRSCNWYCVFRFEKSLRHSGSFLVALKLTEYGVSTACLKWFRSYLSQRSQKTSVGDAVSSKRNVTIGVPQGSVLGPLLFLVFINDLTLSVKYSNTILFADDIAIYFSGKNCSEIQSKMNEDLALVKKWLNDHRLTLNITKSKFVVVGGKQQLKRFQDLTLKIEEDELSRESNYKYLGIIINENMTWGGSHCFIAAESGKKDRFDKRNQSPNPQGATFNSGKHYDNPFV